jgi:hypothetical protein
MSWYDDICRRLTDWLEIKARIIFIGLEKNCNPAYHELVRQKIPNAFFIDVGTCNTQMGLSLTLLEIFEAIEKSKNYLKQDTYVAILFPTIKNFHSKIIDKVSELIFHINQMNARTIVINFYPIDFMNKTNLYYDEVILLSNNITPKTSAKVVQKKYLEILQKINNILLHPQAYDKSMLEINAMLNNGPLENKPILFSQSQTFNCIVQIVDLFAICILLYNSLYLCKSNNKRKFKIT